MKMKVLSVLLAVCLLAAMLPLTAGAAGSVTRAELAEYLVESLGLPKGDSTQNNLGVADLKAGPNFTQNQADCAITCLSRGLLELNGQTGLFEPGTPVMRMSLAKILYDLAGNPPVDYNDGTRDFSGIGPDNPVGTACLYAYQMDLVQLEDGYFRQIKAVTREDLDYAGLTNYLAAMKKNYQNVWMPQAGDKFLTVTLNGNETEYRDKPIDAKYAVPWAINTVRYAIFQANERKGPVLTVSYSDTEDFFRFTAPEESISTTPGTETTVPVEVTILPGSPMHFEDGAESITLPVVFKMLDGPVAYCGDKPYDPETMTGFQDPEKKGQEVVYFQNEMAQPLVNIIIGRDSDGNEVLPTSYEWYEIGADGIHYRIDGLDAEHAFTPPTNELGSKRYDSAALTAIENAYSLEYTDEVTVKVVERSAPAVQEETAQDGTQTRTSTWENGQKAVDVKTPEGDKTVTVTARNGQEMAKVTVTKDPGEPKKFADVQPGKWYEKYIDEASGRKILNGTGSTTFEPEAKLTRGMLVRALYNLSGSTGYGIDRKVFADVQDGDWYLKASDWANALGIALGYNGKLNPKDKITRQDMVTMMYRFAGVIGADTSLRKELGDFPDAGRVSGYAKEAMEWAVAAGLVSGRAEGETDYLVPRDTASRAEVATVLTRFVGYLRG